MTKNLNLIRGFFLLAGIPFLYFVLTGREPNWLYHTSLAIVLAGIVFNMIVDWKAGKKKNVYQRLGVYALIFLVFFLMSLFR
jgi:hypothetical protein